jgi:hypothetical protein
MMVFTLIIRIYPHEAVVAKIKTIQENMKDVRDKHQYIKLNRQVCEIKCKELGVLYDNVNGLLRQNDYQDIESLIQRVSDNFKCPK